MTAAKILEKGLLGSFFILGVVTMALAERLPYRLFRNLGSSPGVFPWMVGLLIATVSLIRLLSDLVGYLKKRPRKSGVQPFASALPFTLMGVSVAFTLLLPRLGFMSSSFLWMTGVLLLFKPRRPLVFVMVVVALITLTYIVFRLYLPVPLPTAVFLERLL